MAKHRHANRLYGNISLAVMAAGVPAIEALKLALHLTHPAWGILSGGFQAGLVGGLADWYAVHVLFHPAPFFMRFWPFSTHSDLVVRNRDKISQNIVDMVQNEWLAPEAIHTYLEREGFFDKWLPLLRRPETVGRISRFLSSHGLLVPIIDQLDRPGLAAFVESAVKERLATVDLARPLGAWLTGAIQRRDHERALAGVLDGLKENVRSDETKALIAQLLRSALLTYLPTLREQVKRPEVVATVEKWARERLKALDLGTIVGQAIKDAIAKGAHDPLFEDLLVYLQEWVATDPSTRAAFRRMIGEAVALYRRTRNPVQRLLVDVFDTWALNRDAAAASIAAAVAAYIGSVRADRTHDLRKSLSRQIVDYAEKLITREQFVAVHFEKLKGELLKIDLRAVVTELMDWAAGAIAAELRGEGRLFDLVDLAALADVAAGAIAGVLDDIKDRPQHFIRAKVDGALIAVARRLSSGEAEAARFVERLRQDLLGHVVAADQVAALLAAAKARMVAHLANREGTLWVAVEDILRQWLADLDRNRARLERLVEWTRAKTRDFLQDNRERVGAIVADRLSHLSNEGLVQQLEGKIGDDLQFIRLNGAVLGFLIGVALNSLLRLTGH